MSIASELTDLSTNLQNAKDAVTAKGGTVGDTGLAGLATEISSIPAGGQITYPKIEYYPSTSFENASMVDYSGRNYFTISVTDQAKFTNFIYYLMDEYEKLHNPYDHPPMQFNKSTKTLEAQGTEGTGGLVIEVHNANNPPTSNTYYTFGLASISDPMMGQEQLNQTIIEIYDNTTSEQYGFSIDWDGGQPENDFLYHPKISLSLKANPTSVELQTNARNASWYAKNQKYSTPILYQIFGLDETTVIPLFALRKIELGSIPCSPEFWIFTDAYFLEEIKLIGDINICPCSKRVNMFRRNSSLKKIDLGSFKINYYQYYNSPSAETGSVNTDYSFYHSGDYAGAGIEVYGTYASQLLANLPNASGRKLVLGS